MKNLNISLVLPCLNEEKQIEKTVRDAYEWFRIKNFNCEVIVVNNASTDHSLDRLKNIQQFYPDLVIVNRQTTGGYGASLKSGCDVAKMEVIAMMDSDGQFDIKDLELLLVHLGKADFVGGIRAHRNDSMVRKIEAMLWNLLLRMFMHVKAKDVDCGMKIFKRSIWKLIRPVYGSGNLFSGEMYYRLDKNNIPWTQVTVSHFPRRTGKAKGTTLHAIVEALYQLTILAFQSKKNPSL